MDPRGTLLPATNERVLLPYSRSQYEAKLRSWGLRKNLKRKEWETHITEFDGPKTPPEYMTSSGLVKDRKRIKRGERYLKKLSAIREARETSQSTASAASTGNHDPIRSMHNSEGVQYVSVTEPSYLRSLDNSSLGISRTSSFLNPQESHSPFMAHSIEPPSGPRYIGANIDPATTTTNQLTLPTNLPTSTLNHTRSSQLNLTQWTPRTWDDLSDPECLSLPQVNDYDEAFSQLLALNSPSPSSQNPAVEARGNLVTRNFATQVAGSLPFGLYSSLGCSIERRTLPFLELEAFLKGKSMTLKSRPGRVSQTSLSGRLSFRFVADMLVNSNVTVARRVDTQTTSRILGTLPPGDHSTAGAVISEPQVTESNMIRTLLFSMMNGFVGLNDIPSEHLLPCLRRLEFFSTSFLQCLQESRSSTSRTFFDNLFRAAIEAKDENIVQLLLGRDLVDINNTICTGQHGRRYTPVERTAFLKAFKLIRTLVDYGADVEKTYCRPQYYEYHGGALWRLLEQRGGEFIGDEDISSPTQLIATIEFLIEKGSKVSLLLLQSIVQGTSNLTMARKNDTCLTKAVTSMLSQAIGIAEHRGFFDTSGGKKAFVVQTVKTLDAETSTFIIGNIVRICKSHGGACLVEFADVLEHAAIYGALKGQLETVELLIDYAKSTDRILSAAIRSDNSDLVQLVLGRKPNLDPPAHCLRIEYVSVHESYLTTPLAEALRAGNNQMIRLLESCGVLSSLVDHERLSMAIFAAAEAGNIPYLRRLLKIASSTKVQFQIPGNAITLALVNGHEEAAYILIEEGATIQHYTQFSTGGCDSLYTELSAACGKRSLKIVSAIFDCDIELLDEKDTAAALKWADPSVLESLLFVAPDMLLSGSLPRDHDHYGYGDPQSFPEFCLHCIETGKFSLFQKVMESTSIEKGDSLNACLAMAIRKGHRSMALYTLHSGANPFSPEVLAAAIPDRPEMLSLLFGNDAQERQQARAPPKCVGASLLKVVMDETPGNAEALDRFLATGAVNLIVPEYIEGDDGCREWLVTPLGLALLGIPGQYSTNVAAVQKFLEAGANPNATAKMEKIPYRCETGLMVALEIGREDIVRLMVEKGADVNLQPRLSLRRTPLQHAAELGNLDMFRLLIRMGAHVDSPPAFQGGGTALQFAAISGNCNIATELLEQGASLGVLPSKRDGRWPLEGAAEHGRLDMIQLLWNAWKSSSREPEAGFEKRQCLRAMDFARKNGHIGCRDLVAELSGLTVEMLETEEYGVPWLAY